MDGVAALNDRRFQIFLSSTYTDLVDERREIIQAVLELDFFPAGMEMFPASSDDAWHLIQSVIRDSDFYIIVLGNRYGSIADDGISFTQKEYEYAQEIKLPVLAFIHGDPDSLPARASELSPEARGKLESFRHTLKTNHHVKFYSNPSDLGSKVSRALVVATKSTTATGWIRADKVATIDAVNEINALRKKLAQVEEELSAYQVSQLASVEHLASGDDPIVLPVRYMAYRNEDLASVRRLSVSHNLVDQLNLNNIKKQQLTIIPLPLTWNEVFSVVSPILVDEATEGAMKQAVESKLHTKLNDTNDDYHRTKGSSPRLDDDDFQTIKVQLFSLGLIEKSDRKRPVSDSAKYWTLTARGKLQMYDLRAIKRDKEV